MNKGIYLLFIYICSSSAEPTPYTITKSSTIIETITKGFSILTTSAKKPTTATISPTIISTTMNTTSTAIEIVRPSTTNSTTMNTTSTEMEIAQPSTTNSTTMSTTQSSITKSTTMKITLSSTTNSTTTKTTQSSISNSTTMKIILSSTTNSTMTKTTKSSIKNSTTTKTARPSTINSTTMKTTQSSLTNSTTTKTVRPSTINSTTMKTTQSSLTNSTTTKTARPSTINSTTMKTTQSSLTNSTTTKTARPSTINSTTTKTTQSSTSTATIKNTTEATTIPLSNFLIEKVDYQINQTHLLTDIVEENRLALKRLISMISHLLDNNDKIKTNHTNDDDEKKHIENIRHVNQDVHHDNDTLHVSFGTGADPDRYPWAVALSGNNRNRCGGTLIDDQHVLTAAHCIGNRVTIVSLGSHLYNRGEVVKTNFYCVHNSYSQSGSYRHDIAVIRLSKPVTVRSPRRVSTIKLCNRDNMIHSSISLNTVNLWMVGWGLKSNNIEPDELQEAQVTLADRSMCEGSSRYTDMCVQSRSNTSPMGACIGDSGSGLFQQTILTNQWCVLGVAGLSNTNICEQTQFSTYVKVASQDYVEWFKDVLDRKKTFDDLERLGRCKPQTLGQEYCQVFAC